jgi:arylsulfatase A-like enzyme
MCFLSGQYVHNHGYYGLMGPRPECLPSLFTLTRRAGYFNGVIGKIHTPTGWLGADCHWAEDQAGREWPGLEDDPSPRETDPYTAYLKEKGLPEAQDQRFLPKEPDASKLDARPSPLEFKDTSEGWIAGRSVAFMEAAQKRGDPFCLWMSMPRPHQAYAPAREFWDLYDGAEIPLPPNADDSLEGRSLAARLARERFQTRTDWMADEPKDWESARRRVLHGYYACVSQVDAAVGHVLAALERMGLRENTIVVYSSDHGEFAGEHGLIEKAPGIGFHCVTRIPMIWSWPGCLPEGETRQELVESIDFLPTLCRFAGLPDPNSADGRDISGLLENGGAVRKYAFTEHPLSRTIQSGRYKLTRFLPEMNGGKPHGELFDHETDPWELNNRYTDPTLAAVRTELETELYEWLVRSTRARTINPRTPASAPGGPRAWPVDFREPVYGADGKADPAVVAQLIAEGKLNYL